MWVRTVTIAAGVLLTVCAVVWVRSYLPEYSTLRAHRGSLVLLFYGRDYAPRIDPTNHPSLENLYNNPELPRPPRRWDTEQTLQSARNWAQNTAAPAPRTWWRALG